MEKSKDIAVTLFETDDDDTDDDDDLSIDPIAVCTVTPSTTIPNTTTPNTTTEKNPTSPNSSPNLFNLGRAHVANSDVESPPTDKETKDERNKQRRNTSRIIDLDNIPNINIILPLKSLLDFLEDKFICRKCRRLGVTTEFEVETFGIANSIHARCECGLQSSARANLKHSSLHKTKKVLDGQSFSGFDVNANDFEINSQLLLGLQLGGGGRAEMKNLIGMLNLGNNPMAAKITTIREDIGSHILAISSEILLENLEIEKEFSPTESDGTKLLCVSNDARWDKRSSGRRYDSPSGCSVMAGNRTRLVIGLEAMSTQCVKCTNNIPHVFANCSHNYEGSSKGMESTGASILVHRVTLPENNCEIEDYVSDDDSSSRAILTHNVAELIRFGILDKSERLRYKGGGVKPDHGELSVDHRPINFLADKGHRTRIYARFHFKLARTSGEKGCGVTNIDAERMKRRMSWTLRLFTGGTYEEFKTAVLAVLEHHFDNHEYCGDWCKAKQKEGEEPIEHGFTFRCKEENAEMYIQFKNHHDKFMEDSSLKQLFHCWDTNAVEGFNMLITKFLPKNKQFATTIENKVRIHLAMCLLSIGYVRFYKRLYKRCGLTRGEFVRLFVKSEDRERQWRKRYRRLVTTKVNRMRNFYRRLKEGREKEAMDKKKGKMYKSGLMSPVGGDTATTTTTTKNNNTCNHCGKIGHSRKSHSNCGANLKNVGKAREEPVENAEGIGDDEESVDSKSSISMNEKTSSYLSELKEMEDLEAVSFNDVIGKTFKSDEGN